MEHLTLRIDPQSMDLSFDAERMIEMVQGETALAQNVRLTLQCHKEGFPLDLGHGIDYQRIQGQRNVELDDDIVDEVLREAIFQEPHIAQIDALQVERTKRGLAIAFAGRTEQGTVVATGVKQSEIQ